MQARRASEDAERAPLLGNDSTTSSAPVVETPLPVRKITILLVMRVAEPVNFTMIFPFINEMVFDIGATRDQARVGFYAGIIESLFALSQTLTILYWGSLSDRIGRKPVLLMGLTGVACSALLFGMSQSFLWAVLARALAGATNGNVAIVKSVMGEITDPTNQARAFSFLPLTWTVGCLIGPLLGGYLSKPADQYPAVFAEGGVAYFGGLWVRLPYFLPCLISAMITVCSIVAGALLLEETLPEIVEKQQRAAAARVQQQEYGATQSGPSGLPEAGGMSGVSVASEASALLHQPRPWRGRSGSSSEIRVQSWASGFTPTHSPPRSPSPTPPATSSVFELLAIPHIQRVMISYASLALIAVALDAVLVLYLYEPAPLGGVGFSSDATGILLSINGLGGAIVQLFLFPPLQRRLGSLRLYQLVMFAFPIAVVFLPVANVFARGAVSHPGGFYAWAVWACLLVSTAVKLVGTMAFASNMILVNQCATLTRGTALGTLNSLAQMSSSATRAVGPYIANTLFALSVTQNLLGGQFVWLALALVGMIGPITSLRIKDLEAKPRT